MFEGVWSGLDGEGRVEWRSVWQEGWTVADGIDVWYVGRLGESCVKEVEVALRAGVYTPGLVSSKAVEPPRADRACLLGPVQ